MIPAPTAMRSLPRAPAPPHILEQNPAHDEHEGEECRPRHALAEGNGGYIQTASLDTFSMLRRKILRAALAVRPFFYLIRTKTSAPINQLHFSRGSQGT